MKITILAVGKEREFKGFELVNEYVDRIQHYYPIEIQYIDDDRLIKSFEKFSESTYSIALDETGKKISSVGLSEILNKVTNQSFKNLIFIIGGAYGIPEELKQKANLTMSLSDMTFTHQMVRLIITEQIYRACTIQKGEKYHHS